MKRLGIILCAASAIGSLGLGHIYTERLEAEVSGGPKVSVLVAVEDIPIASTLTERQIALRDIPRSYIESRHVLASDLKKVLGQRVTSGIKANEALLTTDIAKFAEKRQLSGLIPNGMRAISIDGRAADFDGLLRPADHVDVLLSLGEQRESIGSTLTLLQNLLVLSVGGTTQRSDGNDKTYSRGSTVTVSATVEQSQILTEAMRRGKLTLTLRSGDDITLVEGIGETTTKDLTNRNGQPSRTLASAAASATTKEGPSHVR
jgi:pilus assembly protein CpaB